MIVAQTSHLETQTQLSTLLDQPNVWSDWHAAHEIGPLSWVSMVALLTRSLSVSDVINALAPVLMSTRNRIEKEIEQYVHHAPERVQHVIGFEGYRDFFNDTLPEYFPDFVSALDGDADLEWLKAHVRYDGIWEQSLLWFFLNGIAHASVYEPLDANAVSKEARWLAELEFFEPARLSGDTFLLRTFYSELCASCERAEPLSDDPHSRNEPGDPSSECEDNYITRRRAFDDRWTRELGRTHSPPPHPVEVPDGAWICHMRRNQWDRALDMARVPAFHWKRQAAFILRDVSLAQVTRRLEPVLIDMVNASDHQVLEWAKQREIDPCDITFDTWFARWREHFRHWHEPLRRVLNDVCAAYDPSFLADWLPQFEPAVFTDFLVQCADACALDARLAEGSSRGAALYSDLFGLDETETGKIMDLEALTIKLWHRFRQLNGIVDTPFPPHCDFNVDMNVAFHMDQMR